jgi:rSAM/selenodomain-associated transferase 1
MSCAIAVMAKAPRAGRCKTRLVPPLSPDQAAFLSRAFLRDITENLALAAASTAIAPYVAYAPSGEQHLFAGCLAPGTRLVLADGAGAMPDGVTGFGTCLLHAIRSLLAAGHDSACVLNADSPTLPTAILRDAAAALAAPGDRIVMAPAEDGGYTLLGMKAAHARVFADIAWSTQEVAAQTRARAREAGLDLVELPVWYDVDDHASLLRLRADLCHGGDFYAAPHSAAFLRGLDDEAQRREAS